MSNETGMPLESLREFAGQGIAQVNQAAIGWIDLVRKTLDAAEMNVAAVCDHARKLAQADSPAECMKLHTEFLKSSLTSMQKQSARMMRAGVAAER